MLKRLFCCALLLLVLPSAASATPFESTLVNGDAFYDEQLDHSLSPTQSGALEIGFRVCQLPEGEQTHPEGMAVQYDLVLLNKTGEPLKNLRFDAHFQEPLQIILATPHWYNEPTDIGALHDDDLPSGAIYTWNPSVVLCDLGALGSVELSDFYDFLIEITWDGGREVIRLTQESACIPEKALASLDPREPLDEQAVKTMLAEGIRIHAALCGN